MPDLERETDALAVYMAQTPEDRAWFQGYSKGKNTARKQIAYVAAFLTAMSLLFLPHLL